MDLRIIDDILDLFRRIGRIHRNGDDPIGISAKISIKALRHILRINTDILMRLYPKLSDRLGRKHDLVRKIPPGNLCPFPACWINIFQGRTNAIFLRLAMN